MEKRQDLVRNEESQPLRIERLPEAAWELYRDIRLEALKSEPEAFGSSYEEEAEYGRDVWLNRLPNAIFAIEGSTPIGMAGFLFRERLKQEHVADIFSVYVTGTHRGRGIGRMIMKEALRLIGGNEGTRKVILSVSSEMAAAIALYKSLGFSVAGRLKDELKFQGRYFDEIVMELFLKKP